MEPLIHSTEESVILDYGCASGSFLGTLRKPYRLAIGIDIAKAQIDLANKKYGHSRLRFVTADFESFDPQNESFDYIISSEVIEHVCSKEAEKMLERFHSLLKPTGRLVLSTPNYKSLWPIIEVFVNLLSEVNYEHQHINKLDLKKCGALLEKCGFQIEDCKTLFVLSPFFAGLSERFSQKLYDLEQSRLPNAGSLILVSAVKK